MEFYILASGSKGNCSVIRDKDTTIVIDAGVSKKYLLESLEAINIEYNEIDSLLITHSHSDHIKNVFAFKDKEIYTPHHLGDNFSQVILNGDDSFYINSFKIKTIKLSHDNILTLGYIIENSEYKLVYITDTGYIKNSYLDLIKDAHYYIIESNHDTQMLMNTRRPFFLKQRILGDSGHLNNEEAAQLLSKVVSDKTEEVVLAHLSEEANLESLAINTSKSILNNKIKLKVAKQFEIVSGGNNEK